MHFFVIKIHYVIIYANFATEFFLSKIKYLFIIVLLLFCNTYLFAISEESKEYTKKLFLPKKEIKEIDKNLLSLYKSGNYAKAYELMAKTRTHNAGNFYFHYIYGQTAKNLQKYKEAAAAFERALVLRSDVAGVRFELAKMYIALSNYIEAKILIANIIENASNAKIKEDLQILLEIIDKRNQNHYFRLSTSIGGGTDTNIINQAHDEFYIYTNWQYFNEIIDIANTNYASNTLGLYSKGTSVKRTVAVKSSSFHEEKASFGYTYNKVGSNKFLRINMGAINKEALAANYDLFNINYDTSIIVKKNAFIVGLDYTGSITNTNENSFKKNLKHLATINSVRGYFTSIQNEGTLFTLYLKADTILRNEDKIPSKGSSFGVKAYTVFLDGIVKNTINIATTSETLSNPKKKQMFKNEPNSFYIKDDTSYAGLSLINYFELQITSNTKLFNNIKTFIRKYKNINWLYSSFNDTPNSPERYKLLEEIKRSDNYFEIDTGFNHLFENKLNLIGRIGYAINRSNIPLYKYEKSFVDITFARKFTW
jgi:hypothetical protein